MNLTAYWVVLRRQRRIVALGLLATAVLVLLALVRISPSGVALRSPPTYVAKSTLFVTQSGFPWGRSALSEYIEAQGNEEPVPRFADPSRMEYLANIYAQLAGSDAVFKMVTRGARELPDGDTYLASTLYASDGRSLPLIEVSGVSQSKQRSIALARRVTSSLRRYVQARQRENAISSETRVDLPIISAATQAEVYRGVKLTTSVMLALLGTIATLFVAFTVDNLRRQRQLAESIGVGEDLDVVEPDVHRLGAVSDAAPRTGEVATRTRRRSGESRG